MNLLYVFYVVLGLKFGILSSFSKLKAVPLKWFWRFLLEIISVGGLGMTAVSERRADV